MSENQKITKLERLEMAYYDLPAEGEERGIILLVHGFASTAAVNWINTGWSNLLRKAGFRVVAIDNRGHGNSQKFYSPKDYGPNIFAADALQLLDHLDISKCHIMGYSMGARITCWIAHVAPERVEKAIFGGMGGNMFGQRGGYEAIAQGLEADDPDTITDKGAAGFRKFADMTQSDRLALAACIRPSEVKITQDIIAGITVPVLVAVGTEDEVAGTASSLADMMPNAIAFDIPGLDHMRATGAKEYKARVLEFLDSQ